MANDLSVQVAQALLGIGAVRLQPQAPFTWASGWKSPIYCDNRKTLSHPQVRNLIKAAFAERIRQLYPQAQVVAGVATGAIAAGALVADVLDLPMIYVRSSAKEHGLGNQIEGEYHAGQQVVVIEDLISTGGSSLKAVQALREAGLEVLGMLAIFTYQFDEAAQNFAQAQVAVDTLSNYTVLADLALAQGSISPQQLDELRTWRSAPQTWGR